MLNGPFLAPRGTPKQLVIILHGWGADGANLIDIADIFAQDLPNAYFIAPNGPEACEVNPYGYQWFSLMDRQPLALLSGARKAADALNPFIDAKLAELGLDDSQLALVGFSQGTMLSLHAALRRPKPLACVAGFSGALIGAEVLAGEVVSRPPVCLIHGEMDDVVPFGAMAAAGQQLRSLDIPVQTHARPNLGHSIDMEGMEIAREFLKEHLAG